MEKDIFKEVDHYINALLVPEDEILLSIPKTMEDAGLPSSSVSPNQGKFLQMMALICQAKTILELGTLGGYSTIWLGRALPEDGTMISVEANPAHAAVARKNIGRAGLSGKVEVRVGKAMEVLEKMIHDHQKPFDLIFIDADKEPYAEYFNLSLQLSRPGTCIIADNLIREGAVLDTATDDSFVLGVQRFNKLLSSTEGVTSTILQTVGLKPHDGMSISIVNRPASGKTT
ncbi:MAG TPA: O-methyltransferase [Puia sp.]|nr:O-methyltransferase [Puia sp.]